MELITAICAIGFTVGYGIVLAVGIEKGKPWAFEISRALAMIDPHASYMPQPRELGLAPSADEERSADREPSAGREPSADREPSTIAVEPPAKLVA